MRWWPGAALVALVVACGGGGASQAPTTGVHSSGSRLRALVLDGGDGAVVFEGWQDSVLGAPCRFLRSSDGSWHCLPGDSPSLYGPLADFADAACSEAALVAAAGASASTFAPRGCPGDNELRDVVQLEEQAGASAYFHKDGASCTEMPLPAGQHLYRVVPGDASTYVGARVVTESRGGGLDVEVLLADDGAKQLARSFDHVHAAPCAALDVGAHPEQLARCLPVGISFYGRGYFATSDCSGRDEGSFNCPMAEGCPVPEVAFDESVSADGCTSSFALHTLGPATQAYEPQDAGVCGPVTFGPCYYQDGTGDATLADYPELGRAEVGTGRLRALVRTAAGHGQALAALRRFHDVERDWICGPAEFVDGALRCVPVDAQRYNQGLTYFGDAACTQAIVTADDACAQKPSFALEMEGSGPIIVVAAPVRAVHSVGDAWSGTAYIQGDTGCVATSAASGWVVGDTVDAAGFAPLTERTE